MLIRKCDRCKAEIENDAKRFRVEIIEGGKVYRNGTSKEEILDLCENCRMQLHDFFHPVEITPVQLFGGNVITGIVEKEKKKEKSFWDEHDPSGGDLPPEDEEENLSGGGYGGEISKTEEPDTTAGRKKEKSCKCGPRKNLCIEKSRMAGERDMLRNAHISGNSV